MIAPERSFRVKLNVSGDGKVNETNALMHGVCTGPHLHICSMLAG